MSFTTTNLYESKLYRDLTVGGGGSATVDSGSYHFAGQDWILLDSGFEISGTATAIISTMKCQEGQTIIQAAPPPNPPVPLSPQLQKDIYIKNNFQHQ